MFRSMSIQMKTKKDIPFLTVYQVNEAIIDVNRLTFVSITHLTKDKIREFSVFLIGESIDEKILQGHDDLICSTDHRK